MRRLWLARSRGLTACAGVALAAALAGCGAATTSSTSVSGHTLAIYVSVPPGTLPPEENDVVLAEQLALPQGGTQVGKFTVKLVKAPGNELSDNARGAIANPDTIAYVGELAPGTSAQTLGITNAQDVLQVSPTDTAAELTRSTPAVPGAPDSYYESLSTYGRTFARVVPSTELEAKALVGEMQKVRVKSVYLASDGSQYGKALAAAVRSDAGSIAVAGSVTGAGGVLYAGSSAAGATQVFDQAASSSGSVKLFAPSALARASFATGLSAAAQRELYVSSPGFTDSELPAAGRQFVSAFKAAYRYAPAPEAVFGYEAVEAILAVLHKAGASAGDRGTVVHDFFAIRNRSSAIGTYSINKDGDVVFARGAPFLFSRVKDGKLVAVQEILEQG